MENSTLLALATAGPSTSIALLNQGEVVAYRVYHCPFEHSKWLPSVALDLLHDLDYPPEDIHTLAVAGGPGFFTALRMGLVFAKAWHLVYHTPVVLVPTHEALVVELPLPLGSEITVLLDAQKQEVYHAVLRKTPYLPDVLLPLSRKGVGEVTISTSLAVGSGMVRYFADHPSRLIPTPLQPTAVGIGLWATYALAQGKIEAQDPSLLSLRYGRLPDAVVHRMQNLS